MTKTLISIAILASLWINPAQAGEYSKAMKGCESSVSAYFAGDQAPRVKFREAKSRGAGEAHMFFHVWPSAGDKIFVKCIAKKSSGDVSAMQIRNNETKQWALATQ